MTTPVAFITGAGTGIGRATATLLAREGFRLCLVGRRVEKLREVGSSLGVESHAIVADLRDAVQVERAVADAVTKFGRVDALINNAGHSPAATIPQTTAAMAQEIFALNAVAPTIAISRAWPVMERQSPVNDPRWPGLGRAVVVNVSSYATLDPYPTLYAYAAAKASVNLLAKSVANAGKAAGIRGFAVAPGAVETDLLRSIVPATALPTAYTLSPEEVAGVIVDCVLGRRDADNGGVVWLPSPGPED